MTERVKYKQALSALSMLCITQELFETLVVRLTAKLDILCLPAVPRAQTVDIEPISAYAHSILSTILGALTSKVAQAHTDIPKYIDRLVPRLINIILASALLSDHGEMVAADLRIVSITAHILRLVAKEISAE